MRGVHWVMDLVPHHHCGNVTQIYAIVKIHVTMHQRKLKFTAYKLKNKSWGRKSLVIATKVLRKCLGINLSKEKQAHQRKKKQAYGKDREI